MKSEILKVPELARFVEFANTSAKSISDGMASSYIRKKRAFEASLVQYRKTGSIDMSRISQYKVSDDIFTNRSITKDGKSHGLYLCFDWSGSMSDQVPRMAIQYLIVTLFCKKAGIPFEVATFTSSGHNNVAFWGSLRQTIIADNTMTISELITVYNHMVCSQSQAARSKLSSEYRTFLQTNFDMGGTPLHESAIASYIDAVNLRNRYDLQNVTIMYVTDGDGAQLYGQNSENTRRAGGTIVCPFTKRQYDVRNYGKGTSYQAQLSPINRMCRDAGLKVFNVFIGSETQMNALLPRMHDDSDVKLTDFKRTTESGFVSFENFAYYNRFVVASKQAFPTLSRETAAYGEVSSAQSFRSSLKSNKSLSVLGRMIVDEICEDFKIK